MMQAAVETKMKGPFEWKSLFRVLVKTCKEEKHHIDESSAGSHFGLSITVVKNKEHKAAKPLGTHIAGVYSACGHIYDYIWILARSGKTEFMPWQ